jgi:hypothetical protein
MQAFVNVTCPYCGRKQSAIVDFADHKPYTRPQVIVCDSEEGGCDKWFVFEARATFTVTTGTIGGDLQPAEVQPETPAAPQPDWSKAPEWAQWWAVDSNGEAYYYEVEPGLAAATWAVASMERFVSAGKVELHGRNWRLTAQQRPQEAR